MNKITDPSNPVNNIPAENRLIFFRKPFLLQVLISFIDLLQLRNHMINGCVYRTCRRCRTALWKARLHTLQIVDQIIILLNQRLDLGKCQITVGQIPLHFRQSRLYLPHAFQNLLLGIGDGFLGRLDIVHLILQAEIGQIVSRFMQSAAEDNIVGLEPFHQLAVLPQLSGRFIHDPDHIIQVLMRVDVLDEFIDSGEQVFDQNPEIPDLNIMLCGR